MRRHVLPIAAALALSACTTPPPAPPPAPPEARPQPATEVAPRPPPTAAEQQQAQKIALHVADLLEAGNEEEARSEIDRALLLDPNNKLAQNFLRQMTVDPLAALGAESFAYTVRPGETLSRIAGRFMGDIYAFYLLARYNDVRVPRLVSSGQTIRIPGRAPPPEVIKPPRPTAETRPRPPRPVVEREERESTPPPAAPPPPPVQSPPQEVVTPAEKAYREGIAAQRSGNRERAYQQFRQAAQLDPAHPDARAKADQVRRELVLQHERNARGAFARQDLDGAIRSWERVLELDPGNDTARLEKQKAQKLQQRINDVR
ncbi:MAG: LysM peptidoglycan-binding domain-containing protein [Sterolibacteriaceae bacterium]|nr:LysM peptidoglycan-binding domain-containing protein [Sterolibacteriaceae bacterium]